MTNDTDAILDDLLCRWAQWLRPLNVGRGHAHATPGLAQYRTSRQYDDENGALDDAIDHMRMKAVDVEVQAIDDPYRTAIHCNARALVVGVDVFRSPRLPENREQRQALIGQARVMLVNRLVRAGVM